MVAMNCMAVLTVHIVDVVAMLDRLVTAVGSVGVLVHLSGHMSLDLVLVVMAIVLVVRMAVMQVVDMAVVLDSDMTAVSRVLVAVSVVDLVCLCRRHSSPIESGKSPDYRLTLLDSQLQPHARHAKRGEPLRQTEHLIYCR